MPGPLSTDLLIVWYQLYTLLVPDLYILLLSQVQPGDLAGQHGGVGGQQRQVSYGQVSSPSRELSIPHKLVQPAKAFLQLVHNILARLLPTKHHRVYALA